MTIFLQWLITLTFVLSFIANASDSLVEDRINNERATGEQPFVLIPITSTIFWPAIWQRHDHLVIKQRKTAINDEQFAYPTNNKIDGRLTSGAVIFGAGWGLAGFCPGPAITSISGGNYIVLAFVATMQLGMWLANRYLVNE